MAVRFVPRPVRAQRAGPQAELRESRVERFLVEALMRPELRMYFEHYAQPTAARCDCFARAHQNCALETLNIHP